MSRELQLATWWFCLHTCACLCVKVSMNLADGHQKELNTLLPGACFGESVLMTANDERIANVTAVKPSRSWVLERFGFEEQILERSAGSWKEQFLKGVDLFYRLTAATVRGLAAQRCRGVCADWRRGQVNAEGKIALAGSRYAGICWTRAGVFRPSSARAGLRDLAPLSSWFRRI